MIWTRQPQIIVPVAGELSRGLVFVHAVNNSPLGSLSKAGGILGLGNVLTGTATNPDETITGVTGLPTSGASAFTLEVLFTCTSIASLSHLFGFGNGPGNLGDGQRRGILAFPSTNFSFWGESADYQSTGIAIDTTGKPQHVIFAWPGSGSISYYIRVGNNFYSGSGALSGSLTTTANSNIYTGGRHSSGTVEPTAKIYKRAIYNRALNSNEAISLIANPWQIFQPQVARIYSFSTGGSVDVSPSITGVVGTTAVGTLISSVTAIPSGVSATCSVGTLTPTTAEVVSLVGVAATGAAGTLSVEGDVSIGITGVQATSAAQAIIVEIDKALTGVSATGAVQALGIEIDAAFTGITATGQVGTVGVSTGADASIAFIGVVGTGAAQALTVEIDETPIGVTGTGQVGNLSESTGAGGVFTGVAATGSAGSVTTESDVAIGLAGASAVGQAGMLSVSIGSNISVSITGVVGTAIAGILLPEMAANDPGVEATGQAGNFGTLHLASLNGVVCYGQVGGLQAGEFLLIRNRVEFAPRFSTTVGVTPRFSATVSKGVKF